jgi:hypothetical protein
MTAQVTQVTSDFACERTSLFLATCAQVTQVTSDFACDLTTRHIYKYICGGVVTSPPHTQIYNPAMTSLCRVRRAP